MSLKVVYVSFPVLFLLFSTKKDIYYLINIEYIYIAFYDVKLKYLSILLSKYISLSLKKKHLVLFETLLSSSTKLEQNFTRMGKLYDFLESETVTY